MTRRCRPPTRRPPTRRPIAEPLEGRAYLAALVLAKPLSYPAGATPADLVTADFDGDGHADVAVVNYAAGTVSVLTNDGDGTFAAPASYPVGPDPQSIAVGDFNGDGHPDLVAVGSGADDAYVLLNNGNGTFAPAVAYPVGGVRPEGVAVADVNGDGRPDLVTANEGSGTVSVLAGLGDGTFAAPANFVAGVSPIAVAAADLNGDGSVDLVALDAEDDLVHVLLNKGDGTFPLFPAAYDVGDTAQGLTVADVNNDARPDILVTNLRDADVTVLPNVGDGTFGGSVVRRTGAFPYAVAVADLTGDHRPEIVTADSRNASIGVLVRNAMASYNQWRTFAVGTGPEAVVVADVNGDGRPDVVTADFNDDSIAVVLNQTAFPPLTTTTVTLAASQDPVQQGAALTLTATVTPAPVKGGADVVRFLNGTGKVVGIGTLDADGTATINTAALPVGVTSVTAQYNGNGFFAPAAADLDVTVLTAADSAPLLAPTAVTPTGRGGSVAVPFVPGDAGSATVAVADQGPGRAAGGVAVSLSLVPTAATLSAHPSAVTRAVTVTGPATFGVDLAGGRGTRLPVRYTVPADLIPGSYTIAAALAPARTLTAAQVSPTVATSALPVQVLLGFGDIGTHRGYVLTTTLGNGAVVSLAVRGSGIGGVADDGNGAIAVTLEDTNRFSAVQVTPRSGTVTLASLSDPSPVGTVDAASVAVVGGVAVPAGQPAAGTVSLGSGVLALTLAGATDANFSIGPTYHAALSLGTVVDTAVNTSADLQSVDVTTWAGGSLAAPGIRGAFTSTGDVDLTLALSGLKLRQGLGALDVGGSVAAGFTASVGGSVGTVRVADNFAGVFAAGTTIGSVDVGGDLAGGTVLAGATLGPAAVLGDGDDTFNVGRIAAVQVGGNVTAGSLVAAGLRPASDDPFTAAAATLLRGGSIGRVTVVGTVDPTAAFLAASVPAVG